MNRALKAALARAGITVEEMCGRACISYDTFNKHTRANKYNTHELRQIDKVLHLSDEDIAAIVRG